VQTEPFKFSPPNITIIVVWGLWENMKQRERRYEDGNVYIKRNVMICTAYWVDDTETNKLEGHVARNERYRNKDRL
jgi:hypothetical protein